MIEQYKEQLDRLETKLDSLTIHVTDLRIEQKGLQIKSGISGMIGGAIAAIPVLVVAIMQLLR